MSSTWERSLQRRRSNRHLFERMQEYIDTNYESRYLNAVYISGDSMDQSRAEYIEKGVPVLDKFHMMKYIQVPTRCWQRSGRPV